MHLGSHFSIEVERTGHAKENQQIAAAQEQSIPKEIVLLRARIRIVTPCAYHAVFRLFRLNHLHTKQHIPGSAKNPCCTEGIAACPCCHCFLRLTIPYPIRSGAVDGLAVVPENFHLVWTAVSNSGSGAERPGMGWNAVTPIEGGWGSQQFRNRGCHCELRHSDTNQRKNSPRETATVVQVQCTPFMSTAQTWQSLNTHTLGED